MTEKKSFETASITQDAANQLLQEATKAAKEHELLLAFAVTDASGLLKAFVRMDGAPFLGVDLAIDKAWTAASYATRTDGLNAFLQADAGVAPLHNADRVLAIGGGYPLFEDGKLVGAIGASGDHYPNDMKAVEAAMTACGFDI